MGNILSAIENELGIGVGPATAPAAPYTTTPTPPPTVTTTTNNKEIKNNINFMNSQVLKNIIDV